MPSSITLREWLSVSFYLNCVILRRRAEESPRCAEPRASSLAQNDTETHPEKSGMVVAFGRQRADEGKPRGLWLIHRPSLQSHALHITSSANTLVDTLNSSSF